MPKFLGRNNTRKKEIRSHWPSWVLRLFRTLEEIPWVSLTAVSTLSGVMILFLYFRSIDYFPSDFSALIGLGAATSIGAITVIGVLSVTLIAPAALYRHYSGADYPPDVRVSFKELDLIALQFGGMGGILSWIAYVGYRDCENLLWGYAVVGVTLVSIGVVTTVRVTFPKGSFESRRLRVWASLTLMISGLMPLYVVILLRDLFTASEVNFDILLFALWALAIIGNAKGGTKLRIGGIASISIFLVVLVFVLFPVAATDRPSFFSSMVAQELGVRSNGEVKLHVSKKSCELIAAIHKKNKAKTIINCVEDEWNEVSAVVLSNIGERWLLEFHPPDAKSGLRVLLPRADLQALIPSNQITSVDKARCLAGRGH